jgi:hypothetical protein
LKILPLPENNYTRSQVIASWLELTALSEDDGAALRGDALESMRDSSLFPDTSEDQGKESDSSDPNSSAGVLAQAWTVLRSRERALGPSWPFLLSEESLTRRPNRQQLEQVSAYASMLLIEAASLKWYARLAIQPGDDIRVWFEEIAVVCMRKLSNGLTMRFGAPFPAGWPRTFAERVKFLANCFELDVREPEIEKFASSEQQDDSLDIVSRLCINDEFEGVPYMLVQCATGANWSTHKPAQPNIPLWDKYISWNGPRLKTLAIPFSLREKGELADASVRHLDALILDRQRLSGSSPDDHIDGELRIKLTAWCRNSFQKFTNLPDSRVESAKPVAGRRRKTASTTR